MAKKRRKQRPLLLIKTSRKLQNSAVQMQQQLMMIMTVMLISIFTITSAAASASNTENATATPNYLETGRQITGILNRFMSLGYDKRVRPNYGGPPVEVNVTMRILSISSVSEVMMDFTADFYFRQTWHDPRLSFKKLGDIQTLYVGAEVSKKIWLPDTFFGNEKLAYFHEATTPNVFLRIDHSGEVYRSIRLTVTSSCPMNLQYFPMDRQRCTIEAESYGYNVKDIIYRWARETAVERDKEISLPQFDIVTTEQKYRLEELSSGTYSRLIAEILFARRMGYYLIQIYIPSSLIVVISWVSFWLHRNASPARVQLGVTTVLTMTTLMSSTNAALPKISYVKSIDIFLGTCFVMVFAALLEYATVGYLGKRIAMRKAHVQHAQSQAQARVFAQLQAQGAQGDPVPPIASSLLEPSSATSLLLQSPNLQLITPDGGALVGQTTSGSSPNQQQVSFLQHFVDAQTSSSSNQAPQVPERATHRHCHCHSHHNTNSSSRNHYQVASSTTNNTNSNNTLLRSCCYAQPITAEPFQAAAAHSQVHRCRHCKYQSNLTCHTLPQNSANSSHQVDKSSCPLQVNHHLSSSQPHLCCLEDSQPLHQHQHHQHHHQHQHLHHQQQQQQHQQEAIPPGETPHLTCHLSSPPNYSNNLRSGASAAATAAAATFINLHRKKQGLPPSTNPAFAQYAWMGQNCGVETIFGVRPSDIDKYSRVVFPVCFVCFQLMYWIVYLHISAFLEHEHQKPVN